MFRRNFYLLALAVELYTSIELNKQQAPSTKVKDISFCDCSVSEVKWNAGGANLVDWG